MEALTPEPLHYPESDGQPMADNTRRYRWIVSLCENLRRILPCFVGADLLWYPVQGAPWIRIAPDTMVTFGRPPGDRGSYKQWEEGGVTPQVVFEVSSPGNTFPEMLQKRAFYEQYGVDEFYLIDPDRNRLHGWIRQGGALVEIANMSGWVSPRLDIRFQLGATEPEVFRPDGTPFLSFEDLERRAASAQAQARAEAQRAEAAEQRAEAETQRAEDAEAELEVLRAKLRALGVEP